MGRKQKVVLNNHESEWSDVVNEYHRVAQFWDFFLHSQIVRVSDFLYLQA